MRQRRMVLLVASYALATTFMGFATGRAAGAGTPDHTIFVTRFDSGDHYPLHEGDHLVVRLSGPSYATWSEPASTNKDVLKRTGGSSGEAASGRFLAVAKGEVKVTAGSHLVCSSICAGPSLPVFEISVMVVGAATWAVTSRTIKVNYSDNGHRYRLHKSDHLDVQLSSPSIVTWTEPSSSNQAVLQRTGGSSGAMSTGAFIATAKGRVQVTATGTPSCAPVCQLLVRFEISVPVVG